MTFVALATCTNIPEPDVDEPLLVEALEALGVPVRVLPWDDEAAPWADARLVVLRSTWNYYLRPSDFLAWASRCGARLVNSLSIVRWNHHKRYLRELEGRGIPIVPTLWFDRGQEALDPDRLGYPPARSWSDVVAKPAVSAASHKTSRLRGEWWREPALAELVASGDAMVQPYVASVEAYGERSIVFIDGAVSHGIRKTARFTGGAEAVSGAVPIADDERALALRAIEMAPGAPLYARADIVRDASGNVMLSELEMLEPSLYLRQNPAAGDRLARAIARRLRQAPSV